MLASTTRWTHREIRKGLGMEETDRNQIKQTPFFNERDGPKSSGSRETADSEGVKGGVFQTSWLVFAESLTTLQKFSRFRELYFPFTSLRFL